MPSYFKGKSFSYHTEVTPTNGEKIYFYITFTLLFLTFILSFIFIKNVWICVLVDFSSFTIIFLSWLCMIFRSSHEDERIDNTKTKRM